MNYLISYESQNHAERGKNKNVHTIWCYLYGILFIIYLIYLLFTWNFIIGIYMESLHRQNKFESQKASHRLLEPGSKKWWNFPSHTNIFLDWDDNYTDVYICQDRLNYKLTMNLCIFYKSAFKNVDSHMTKM